MCVSIIIPVYNVEQYLEKCLESALCQTYKDIEIILVDDGSTDRSGEMCDRCREKDDRVRVVHKENGGLASARNTGIRMATGKYITFLDSDDCLAPDFIKRTVELCESTGSKMAVTKILYVNSYEEMTGSGVEGTKTILNAEQAIAQSLYQHLFSCEIPGKLYSTTLFDEVRFPHGRISEDLAVFHLLLHGAGKIVYTDFTGYYYLQRGGSIMHSFNPKRLDALEWAGDIEKFCAKNYPRLRKAALCRTFNVAMHLLLDMPESGDIHDKYCPVLWNEIKRTRVCVLTDRQTRGREKAAAMLSYFGEKALRSVWESRLAVRKDKGKP